MKNWIIILLLIFSSCSSSYHLKKAYEKDPTLLVQDTLYIPDIQIDTFYSLDTIEIKSDLSSILDSINSLDSCSESKEQIIQKVTEYITTSLITDTLTYHTYLENDSMNLHLNLQVWQEEGKLKFNAIILDSSVTTPATIIVENKDSFFTKLQEIIGIILFILICFLLITRK